ncbi:MAG: transporter substrate-binding domain-containing protein [Oceanospirillaceae bacterium]|nr:transporter substrate-binding domain-containing protein [Oceanospirillaceae bacterium]
MKKLLLTAALVAATSTAWAGDVIRMGTEGAYPPYNFINDAGEVDGMERELGDELCKRAGLTCAWVTNDWDSIIPNLVSGNYDTIIAGMSITDARDEVIDFTEAYIPADPSGYLVLDADLDVTSAVIAVQSATIQSSFVAEKGWTMVEFATTDDTIAAVLNGEADAVLGGLVSIREYANDELVVLARQETIGGGVGMGIRESNGDLKAKFNKAIQSMKADGTLNELIVKWEVGYTW